jgi:hypothetical protein
VGEGKRRLAALAERAAAGPSDCAASETPLKSEGRAWPLFDISVLDFPPFVLTAATRGKALAEALSSYQNYDDRMTFKEFMRIARVRRRTAPVDVDGYDYVRTAYGVDPQIGSRMRLRGEGPNFNGRLATVLYPNKSSTAYVHVIIDGDDRACVVHPMNVEAAPGEAASPAGSQLGLKRNQIPTNQGGEPT